VTAFSDLFHDYLRWLRRFVNSGDPELTIPVKKGPKEDGPEAADATKNQGNFRVSFFMDSISAFALPVLWKNRFYERWLVKEGPLFHLGFSYVLQMWFPLVASCGIALINWRAIAARDGDGLYFHLLVFNVIDYAVCAAVCSVRYAWEEEGNLITVEETTKEVADDAGKGPRQPRITEDDKQLMLDHIVPNGFANPIRPEEKGANKGSGAVPQPVSYKINAVYLWLTVSACFTLPHFYLIPVNYAWVLWGPESPGVFSSLTVFVWLSWLISCVCFSRIAFVMTEVVHNFYLHVVIMERFTEGSRHSGLFKFDTIEGIDRWVRCRKIAQNVDQGKLKALAVWIPFSLHCPP